MFEYCKSLFLRFLAFSNKIFILPLKAIDNNYANFFVWLFSLIVLGLLGVWLKVLSGYLEGVDGPLLPEKFLASTLSLVSNVVIIEGLFSSLKGEMSQTRTIREVREALYLPLIITFVSNLVFFLKVSNDMTDKYWVSYILAGLSLAFAIYFYCLKDDSWIKSVKTRNKEEDNEVESASTDATTDLADELMGGGN